MKKAATDRPADSVPASLKDNYVVFDLEATGLTPWYGDRVTCVCARDSQGGEFQEIWEDEQKIIRSFLDWLKKRSPAEFMLVSKNGRQFDVPFLLVRLALARNLSTDSGLFILDYPHFDLHELTDKWVTLNDMAKLFKCSPKSGSGERAIRLWKEKQFAKLKAYCMQDVITTEQVFLKWRSL
jgi:uncharacterized protein YprB with RNaseH-like and TPR domain